MISPESWARLKPILDSALELTQEDRPAYLDQVCGDDPELREEAERMLRACEQGRRSLGFLDSPATDLAAPLFEQGTPPTEQSAELEPGVSLGPYRIGRRLGAGGMGVVYLAHDPRLNRKVALKLLPPWMAADESAKRRFAQEAMAASQLDHPNIQTVYEIGETPDARLYIALAYYDGETLKDRIARGRFEIDSAVDLARQIAEGLEAAHARDIVHRDIKPSNVIVTKDGVAKIVDFGAAKVAGQRLTVTEAALGTVAYMSPEQTRREDPDGRTDIWSLGVILYEMLTGRRPFVAQLADAVIYSIRNEDPQPLRQVRPDVSEPLAALVHRCLEKDPRARYPNAAALAIALRQSQKPSARVPRPVRAGPLVTALAAASLIAAALIGASILWPRLNTGEGPPGPADNGELLEAGLPEAGRLAVLPFADSSADAEDAYFAEGLSDEMISRLSKLEGLRVVAPGLVKSYDGMDKTMTEMGRELGVGALLAASVRKEGDRFRISARLIDARTQQRIWSKNYEEGIANAVTVQHDIVQQVVAALGVRARPLEWRRLEVRGTKNAEAYTEYLKGRYFLARLSTTAVEKARSHFQRALDLDPTFANAWSGLSDAYNHLATQGALRTNEAYPRARAAAEQALQLDPELGEAHAALATVLSWYHGDGESAERHFLQALELEPRSGRAHRLYAEHLRNRGRFEEALNMVHRARELDPLSAWPHTEEGIILYLARDYDQAIAKYEQLLRADPGQPGVHFFIALARAQKGQYEEALAALQEMDPQMENPDAVALRGYVYARDGRGDDARSMLARLDELSGNWPVSSFVRAAIYVGLGDNGRALDLLETAAEEPTWHVRILGVEPIFDPLRDEDRFKALLKKLHLDR